MGQNILLVINWQKICFYESWQQLQKCATIGRKFYENISLCIQK